MKLLPDLDAERRDLQVVEIFRQMKVFVGGRTLHLVALTVDIARILGGYLDLLNHGFT